MRTTFITVAVLAMAPARADFRDLTAPVDGHPTLTYFDLLSKAIPGLTLADGVASGRIELSLPHIDHSFGNETDVSQVNVTGVEVQSVEADGNRHLVLLAELGPVPDEAIDPAALALFDADLNLLDLKDVGIDAHNHFAGAPTFIDPANEAFAVYSSHFNSQQTYGATSLILVHQGKLQLIDAISTFGDRWCGHRAYQHVDYQAQDGGQGGYWPVKVTVEDTLETPAEDCDSSQLVEQPFRRKISVIYNWNAEMGGYVADSDAFVRLAEANAERY